jgi:hypothetical protein
MTAKAAYETARQDAIAKARALIASLESDPEYVNWGHVGSVQKIASDLSETNRFAGVA